MKQIRFSLFMFATLLIAGFAQTSTACMCGEVSPCQHYATADVVFVGEVVKTSTRTAEAPRLTQGAVSGSYRPTEPVARLRVLEAFHGVGATELEISGGGSTCDFRFVEGKQYLVYADRDQDGKSLYTSICSGTASIDEAGAEIRYLHSHAGTRNGTTAYGSIDRMIYPRRGDPFSRPLSRWKVIFESGQNRFVAVTNEKGRYRLSGLPKGHYTVYTSPTTNDSILSKDDEPARTSWEMDMPGQGCSLVYFGVIPDAEVMGRLLGTGSKKDWPSLDMVSVDRQNNIYSRFGAKVDDNGEFKFTHLPAGRYLLGINLNEGPSGESPYDEFFYPGVRDRNRAVLIVVKKDQKLTGLELPVPETVNWRIITGTAVYPDGRPLKNEWIELYHLKTDYREGNGERTDSEGRFQIQGMEGQTYKLSSPIEYKGRLVNSKPILIKVGNENPPVKLVVELPKKKRKR